MTLAFLQDGQATRRKLPKPLASEKGPNVTHRVCLVPERLVVGSFAQAVGMPAKIP